MGPKLTERSTAESDCEFSSTRKRQVDIDDDLRKYTSDLSDKSLHNSVPVQSVEN